MDDYYSFATQLMKITLTLKYKFEPMPILYQAILHMKAIKLASRMYNTHFSSSRYWFLCKSPMPILYQASPHMKAIKLASRMYNTHFSSSRYWFLCKSPMPILYQASPHMKAIKFSIPDV